MFTLFAVSATVYASIMVYLVLSSRWARNRLIWGLKWPLQLVLFWRDLYRLDRGRS